MLAKRRTVAEMIMVYKIMRRIVNSSVADMSLKFSCTNIRKGHIQLEQTIVKRAFDSYFQNRMPSVWNKMNLLITGAPSM